jgi:hypothetical protein
MKYLTLDRLVVTVYETNGVGIRSLKPPDGADGRLMMLGLGMMMRI